MFVSRPMIRYREQEAREAIAASLSWTEALRRLEMCGSGGNWRTLKKYAVRWGISTEHFDPYARQRGPRPGAARPLAEVLVEGSSYCRATLKGVSSRRD
jgi:hypothetical protein